MKDPRPLTSAEDFRRALIELLGSSRRSLNIFSEHLDRALYHDAEVVEALSRFARDSRFVQVRILIRDSDPVVRHHHRLHHLTQRLSSIMEIRKVQATVDTPDWEFAVADDRQLLVRDERHQWLGVYEADNPARSRKLLDVFEQDWPLAVPDGNLRRLLI
ncbi:MULTISPECIES: hypothetical protein [unclassified Microbulbifer]|uniref:DUF7931 domain-containing protein n=1 Tax=unclassified Microbulbifer TaxID=2619833 RepID=UPI0027E3B93D|nr:MULTISPECIES: hypothetical protein [unclassified Microbulbifer]